MSHAFKILIVYFLFATVAISAPVTVKLDVVWSRSAGELIGPLAFEYDPARNSEIEDLYHSPGGSFYEQKTNLTKVIVPNFPRPDGAKLPAKPDELQTSGMNLTYQVGIFIDENGVHSGDTGLNRFFSESALIYRHPDDVDLYALRVAFFRLELSNFQLPASLSPATGKDLLDKTFEAAWLQGKEFNVSIEYDDYGIPTDEGEPLKNSWEGTATIASIIPTPIPGAVWLLGSAISVLLGFKRKVHGK